MGDAGPCEIWKFLTCLEERLSSSLQELTETLVSGQLSRMERMCPLSWMDMNKPLGGTNKTRRKSTLKIEANSCAPPEALVTENKVLVAGPEGLLGSSEDVPIVCARQAYGWGVNDRHQFFNVVHQEPVEESLVSFLNAHQVDIPVM